MNGAILTDNLTTDVKVWAPQADRVAICLLQETERQIPLERNDSGYFSTRIDEPLAGVDYFFELDGWKRRADPASRYQPNGVHGPSQVVDLTFPWNDADWRGLPLSQYVLYELHVGCFTEKGDFDAVIGQLDPLADLGVTAVELMPVAQFPGKRNWGYDGVFPYAVQNSYGGPQGLQRLVDACHARGIAVVLDVVYNHLGPEGNYLAEFGPYFTTRYHTPWGNAINFDGPHSDEVRRFFLENALYWIREFHIDGLRLDAIQMVFDASARPFLRELATAVHQEGKRLKRRVCVIGETNQNDVRQITPAECGGLGLDAVWNDDFHHSLHALLTAEKIANYRDHGGLDNFAKAFREGFVLTGQYSHHYKRRHGSSSRAAPSERMVVFAQNHDQTGNRLYGERLSELVSFEQLKMAAGAVMFAPFVPLLFMGEEYGETAPFLFFVDHSDEDLLQKVTGGRLKDHPEFVRKGEAVPDPRSEETFRRSVIRHKLRTGGKHRTLWEYHRRLIELRKTIPSLALPNKDQQEVTVDEKASFMQSRRWCAEAESIVLYHFGSRSAQRSTQIPDGRWMKVLDSADERWRGPGATLPESLVSRGEVELEFQPSCVAVYERDRPRSLTTLPDANRSEDA